MKLLTLTLLILTLNACEKGLPRSQSAENPVKNEDSQGIKMIRSADGTVELKRTALSEIELGQVRNQYRRTSLLQIPVDAKYNVNAFKIKDETIAEYKDKVFIAPRLYSYGTQDGGKLIPLHNPDGTVTLAFNVIFLDGIQKEVPTPEGSTSKFKVPDLFTVQQPDELRQSLKNTYGTDGSLYPLPGCPKRLILEALGKEYEVTPKGLVNGDACAPNTPIAIALTVSEDDAKAILNIGLPSNTVDIRGVFETQVAYPVSNVSISFDRSKIFTELSAKLGVTAWITDVEAKLAIEKIMKQQSMSVMIQGADSSGIDKMVSKVTDEFFEAWAADPANTDSSPCGKSPVCIRLSYTKSTQTSRMEVSWADVSNQMVGQNFITSTKLKSTPKTVRIGDVNCNESQVKVGNCERLLNDGLPRETGLTIESGNIFELSPDYVVREKITAGEPTVTRTNNVIFDGEGCAVMCQVNQHFGGSGNPAQLPQYCFPHDHWVDTHDYNIRSEQDEKITVPEGQLTQLYSGLYLHFEWINQESGKLTSLECPLASFPGQGNGRTYQIQIQNVNSCKPFNRQAGQTVMLSLVNKISFPLQYQTGVKHTKWDGSSDSTLTSQTFNPKVDFAGSLTVLGYAFESVSSSGSL